MKNFFLLLILFGVLSLYCVYEQVADSHSISLPVQKERHEKFMASDSDFYNPWQYRVLSSYLLEAFIQGWDKVTPFLGSGIKNNPNIGYFPFLFIRFLQNILIFFAAFAFYKALGIKSNVLLLTGILLLGFNMSNSTYGSDLSINTYFDVLFYLLAGYIILERKNIWIIPLTLAAALNRETSAFIPLMFLLFNLDLNNLKIPGRKILTVFSFSVLCFLTAYFGMRWLYGLPEYHGINGIDTPWEFLRFNLTYGAFYPEMFGTLGFAGIVALLRYKYWNYTLKLFFWLIIPFWFFFHLIMSQAMETRLFLVPQALIFVPALLYVIEFEIKKASRRLVVSAEIEREGQIKEEEKKSSQKKEKVRIGMGKE